MSGEFYLGIEGGGTRTVALFGDARGRVRRRIEVGPLNLKLATDAEMTRTLRVIRRAGGAARLQQTSLCLAGCRTESDRRRVRRLARKVFGRGPCFAGNDLDSGLAAAFGADGEGILIISGTGSCVVGRRGGRMAKAGGWGHLLGDHGSGYWIALTGLRHAIREYDRTGKLRPALRRVLRRLKRKTPRDLVDWIHSATKGDIAALGVDVMRGDHALMLQSASFLAMDAATVARELDWESPPIALTGGVLKHCPAFRRVVVHRLRQFFPRARIESSARESACGALALAVGLDEQKSFL